MKELQQREHITYLFISHNLAVVRYLSDQVAIMYLVRIVELSSSEEIFAHPKHPYTELLLESSPNPDPDARRMHLVPEGEIPSYGFRPSGCAFHPRCSYAKDICKAETPVLEESDQGVETAEAGAGEAKARAIDATADASHVVACHFHNELKLRAFDN